MGPHPTPPVRAGAWSEGPATGLPTPMCRQKTSQGACSAQAGASGHAGRRGRFGHRRAVWRGGPGKGCGGRSWASAVLPVQVTHDLQPLPTSAAVSSPQRWPDHGVINKPPILSLWPCLGVPPACCHVHQRPLPDSPPDRDRDRWRQARKLAGGREGLARREEALQAEVHWAFGCSPGFVPSLLMSKANWRLGVVRAPPQQG